MKQGTHIGGLVAVGFDPTGAYLLTVSHSGRGVFSTGTWDRLARDYELTYPENGRAIGIGPMAGMSVAVTELDSEHDAYITSPDGKMLLHCATDYIEVVRADK